MRFWNWLTKRRRFRSGLLASGICPSSLTCSCWDPLKPFGTDGSNGPTHHHAGKVEKWALTSASRGPSNNKHGCRSRVEQTRTTYTERRSTLAAICPYMLGVRRGLFFMRSKVARASVQQIDRQATTFPGSVHRRPAAQPHSLSCSEFHFTPRYRLHRRICAAGTAQCNQVSAKRQRA